MGLAETGLNKKVTIVCLFNVVISIIIRTAR